MHGTLNEDELSGNETKNRSHRGWFLALLVGLVALLALVTFVRSSAGEEPGVVKEEHAAGKAADAGKADDAEAHRLSMDVRRAFFRAVQGEPGAMEEALTRLEEVLAEHPQHAEAMVYHGSLKLARSGAAFETGDAQRGMELWMGGLAEMDRAVELAPQDLGVRIPRGATLLFVSREAPPEQAPALLARTLEDYGFAYAHQREHLELISSHARGELLLGLADAHRRLGHPEEARELFETLAELEPESGYGAEARAQLAAGPEGTERPVRLCQGCHVPGKEETAK